MIGHYIKSIRTEIGISQLELAQSTGLTQGYISGLEHDRFSVSIETLKRIADRLDVSLDDIIEYDARDEQKYGKGILHRLEYLCCARQFDEMVHLIKSSRNVPYFKHGRNMYRLDAWLVETYVDKLDIERAYDLCQRLLDKPIYDQVLLAHICNNMGRIHLYLNQLEPALEYCNKAHNIVRHSDNNDIHPRCLRVSILYNLGCIYLAMEQFDNANKSLTQASQSLDDEVKSIVLKRAQTKLKLCEVERAKQNHDAALQYALDAYHDYEFIGYTSDAENVSHIIEALRRK